MAKCCIRQRRHWCSSQPERGRDGGDHRPGHDLRPGVLRRLRGDLESANDAAHAADVRRERDPRHHHRRRDARGRRDPDTLRLDPRVPGGGPRHSERCWRLRRDRPDARDVQAASGNGEEGREALMDFQSLIPIVYLVAAVTFILGLKGLSGPRTAVNGNRIAAAGMLLAVAVTFFDQTFRSYGTTGLLVTAAGMAVGGGAGFYGARVGKMTAMPPMV